LLLIGSVVAVFCAAVLGGATGFAASLLATPFLLLSGLDLASVVVVNLVATLVTRVVVVVRERHTVDRSRVLRLGLGCAPGAWAGALVIGLLDPAVLRVAAGLTVTVLGTALFVTQRVGFAHRPGAAAELGTGIAGGFLSTSTSLNGPPVAILLQQQRLDTAHFIADLAAYFVIVNSVSLLVLGLQDRIPAHLLWPTLPVLILAALLGNQVGGRLTRLMPDAVFRTVTVVLVVVSGLVTAFS